MKCRVCKTKIEDHSDVDLQGCLLEVGHSPAFAWGDALGFAKENGFLLANGSDGGDVMLCFRGQNDFIRTRTPVRAIYSHYLAKVYKPPKEDAEREEASEVME